MFSINDQAITGAQSLAMEEHNDYNIKQALKNLVKKSLIQPD